MAQSHTLLLGAHMSIAGGFDQAIVRGESIGCTCIQIFTKSNKQWHARPIDPVEAEQFKATLQKSTIKVVMAHASYLINIGSNQSKLLEKSIESLVLELQRCELLGIPYLVLHPGVSSQKDMNDSIKQITDTINTIFKQYPWQGYSPS